MDKMGMTYPPFAIRTVEEIREMGKRAEAGESIYLYTVYLDSNDQVGKARIINGPAKKGGTLYLLVKTHNETTFDSFNLSWRNIPTPNGNKWFSFANYWHAYAALLRWRADGGDK
jgi:hypothetical protein